MSTNIIQSMRGKKKMPLINQNTFSQKFHIYVIVLQERIHSYIHHVILSISVK